MAYKCQWLFTTFCPWHFVHDILSVTFCQMTFCPYNILSATFCPATINDIFGLTNLIQLLLLPDYDSFYRKPRIWSMSVWVDIKFWMFTQISILYLLRWSIRILCLTKMFLDKVTLSTDLFRLDQYQFHSGSWMLFCNWHVLNSNSPPRSPLNSLGWTVTSYTSTLVITSSPTPSSSHSGNNTYFVNTSARVALGGRGPAMVSWSHGSAMVSWSHYPHVPRGLVGRTIPTYLR